MADFCTQCSRNMFGKDYGDMRGLSHPIDTCFKLYPVVLCEGCGATQVNHRGECIHHNEKNHIGGDEWYENQRIDADNVDEYLSDTAHQNDISKERMEQLGLDIDETPEGWDIL